MNSKIARLAAVGCLFFVLGTAALWAQQAQQFNAELALSAQREKMPAGAAFTLGDSKAARLVMQTKQAILNAQSANVPQLALTPEADRRAFEQAVLLIAGTEIPKNFLELERTRVKPQKPPVLALSPGADPNVAAFDWRKAKKVTPIRDQNPCGSCWCFAAVAAYESNHLLKVGGAPEALDASEQQILNCADTGGCNGDWYMTAWSYMKDEGTASEHDVPYHAAVERCSSNVAKPYHVDAYALVSETEKIPSVKALKEALCENGPLAVAVQADDEFVYYRDGVFESFPSDGVAVNHAVTLIGWDDSKSAWIIKNSWGDDWGCAAGEGDKWGYMYIKYNANNIGYAAAWATAKD